MIKFYLGTEEKFLTKSGSYMASEQVRGGLRRHQSYFTEKESRQYIEK